jgi:hypothetical protein
VQLRAILHGDEQQRETEREEAITRANHQPGRNADRRHRITLPPVRLDRPADARG